MFSPQKILFIFLASMECLRPCHAFDSDSQETVAPKREYQIKYCLQYEQLEPNLIANMIKEMSQTPYLVDDYFIEASCQSKGYSINLKSPILHLTADDPNGKERSLEIVGLYYIKKRADVKQFTSALNAKNGLGETFLDYVETLQRKGITSHPDQQPPIIRIIKFACRHGATYSKYMELSCSKTD